MKASFLSEDPHVPDLVLEINGEPLVMGRSEQAQLRVPDPMVSRRHCELVHVDGQLCIRDLGSTNGTLVNGEPVGETLLRPGDHVLLGMANFTVSYEPETADELPAVDTVMIQQVTAERS